MDRVRDMDVGGGASASASVGAGAGGLSVDEPKDVGSDVYEEAVDTPKESFYTPHHGDSRDFLFKRADGFGDEEVREALKFDKDAPVSNPGNGERKVDHLEKIRESPDDDKVNGAVVGNHEAVDFDAQSLDEQMSVGFGEKMDAHNELDLTLNGSAELEENNMAGEGVGDVEGEISVLADGASEKQFVVEKSENEKSSVLAVADASVSNPGIEEQEVVSLEKVEESPNVLVNGQILGNHEGFGSKKSDEPLIAVDAQSSSDQAAVDSEEKMGTRDESYSNLERAADVEADSVARKGVTDVEGGPVLVDGGVKMGEDGEKELVAVKTENGESNGVNSDRSHSIVPENRQNGSSHDPESKEQQVPRKDRVPQKPDVSVRLDVPSNKEAGELKTDLAQTHNPIEAETNASVAKDGGSLMQSGGPTPKSGSNSTAGKEFEKETVLVEDLGESSSSDDDDNKAPSQPASSTNSPPTSPGAPSLPSRPAGPGSSVSAGGPSLPSRPAGLGSSASARGLSLPSRPAGLGSSAPAGGPSLPSRPAGLGSSAPTGAPSFSSRPAGLGSSSPLLEPASRSLQQPRVNGSVLQRQSQPSEEVANDDAEENDETREKLQMIRVKFLRLAHRLGQTPHNVVVAQVLYRLGLAEQLRRSTNRPGVFSFDRASIMAEQLETAGQEPLDFSCTIMVIGKSGVGKSSTINSIFDEVKFHTDAFQPSTKKVQEKVGIVQGIKVRVIDTPGLFAASSDQRCNEKILRSVKKFISKTPPDIVLYFDRLDMQSRDFGDVPLLRTIADVFGASIWFNAIVVLTHAASAPPDGPNGTPLSYEMFVTQRSHVVQQAIRQASGDVRLMNPVSLVENHSACRMNRDGQRVLPNGQVWKPQLLLLSFASKILAEANMLLKLQDSPPGKPFGSRTRVTPLPLLLNSILQSRPQLKLPDEQFDDEDTIEDADEASDGGSDYDDLPPFKSLTKAQLDTLNKAQKKAYFEEFDYREKLLLRKQLTEEKKRRKLMKKMAEGAKDLPRDFSNENLEDENSGPASVPVPLPDHLLPASFDSDTPNYRYRSLDSSSQWLVSPVMDSQGWDHDVGYESLNIERLFVVKDKIPVSVSGQLTKDKKDFNLQMEAGSSIKHSEGKATSLAMDLQTVGKDVLYTIRGETRFKNFRRNNTAAGLSVTVLGDSVSAGMKIEDKLIISKTLRLLMSGGAMTSRGDVAYGGRLEATLRDKDFPVGRMLSTLALSIVDWHGDLALGCTLQSQIPLGRGTNLIGQANMNNRGSGQIGIRLNTSENLQIALLLLVPLFRNVKRMLSGSSQSM